LVEARDDIVLATSNLISDNLFHWKILDLLSTLNETEQNAISVTIDGITYTVNEYLKDVLQADITEHENNLKAWRVALEEANKILAINPTDADMIKLRDSAYFSIPMEEEALEKAITDKKEFENNNPQYLLYKKMKDITDTIKTLKLQYEKDYITNNNKTGTLDLFNKASANYTTYWLLAMDLLYSSQSDKITAEYTKEQLQTLLKDAMDNSQLYYEIPDFCFNEDNIFTSKFGCIVLDQKIMPLLNNMRDDFDLNTYDSYMEIYH